jgi:hypothetical protein
MGKRRDHWRSVSGCAVAVFAMLALGASTALAGSTVLGTSGWRASWDPTLDPYVNIYLDTVDVDAVYITKSADFTQPPGPGGFAPIPILFEQIAWPAVHQIVIEDETITNHTGHDWTDFHWDLLDGTDATFNDGPDFLFTTSPFDNQSFSPDLKGFWVDGFGLGPGGTDAVIPNGTVWTPGSGAGGGQLAMDVVVNQNEPYTIFTLKETPTPEPAAIVLLLAALAACRRR